ncbi:MAG: hypothetical protein IPK08_11885 [Bacteroidetes bacterium]|nr:hypothetical protein [Bacteroidota bacterium]
MHRKQKKSKWVRYFIQAKRQTGYKLNGRYKAIEKSQLDTLKSWAKKNKGIPLCALYKNLQLNNGDLYEYYNSITEFDKRAMGITLAIPDSFLKGNDFNTLHIFNDNFLRIFHRYRYNPKHLAFYNHNVNTAVPFHELAYFTIEFAEAYNEEYKKQNAKNILSFFFFFCFSNSFLYGDVDNLIPIINSSPDELIIEFDRRLESKEAPFNSSAILILDTFEE